MHTEVFVVYDTSERHAIEYFHDKVIEFYVVTIDDLLSESEILSHVSALVIAS